VKSLHLEEHFPPLRSDTTTAGKAGPEAMVGLEVDEVGSAAVVVSAVVVVAVVVAVVDYPNNSHLQARRHANG
jgi:hypothetical protein